MVVQFQRVHAARCKEQLFQIRKTTGGHSLLLLAREWLFLVHVVSCLALGLLSVARTQTMGLPSGTARYLGLTMNTSASTPLSVPTDVFPR